MNNYNADSIKILSDLDHIRKRSEMYISDNGCSHLLQEIMEYKKNTTKFREI